MYNMKLCVCTVLVLYMCMLCMQSGQHTHMQVGSAGRTPALEVATAGPQTPLELAASVATAVPGHHHQSSAAASTQNKPGVLLLPIICPICFSSVSCLAVHTPLPTL